MPSFVCSVCGDAFSVPQSALDKYPNWQPKFCREHSPKKNSAPRRRGAARGRGGGAAGARVEENLTLAGVLERYSGGPSSGMFTDGSAVPNPGRGGWGAVWVRDGDVVEQRYGSEERTTNNRMELKALVEAFDMLSDRDAVTVYSDSRLCVDTLTKWAPGWERKGWKKKGGEIKNLELVQEALAGLRRCANAELQWIKAHSGNRWNEYADSLATAWMREEL